MVSRTLLEHVVFPQWDTVSFQEATIRMDWLKGWYIGKNRVAGHIVTGRNPEKNFCKQRDIN
jgi:hypothetical protein